MSPGTVILSRELTRHQQHGRTAQRHREIRLVRASSVLTRASCWVRSRCLVNGSPTAHSQQPRIYSIRNSLQYFIQRKIKYGGFVAQGKGHLVPSAALQIPIAQCHFIPRLRKVHTRQKEPSAESDFINNIVTLMRQALGSLRKSFPK